jgi:hypothetical protein
MALIYQPEVIKPLFIPSEEFENEFDQEFEEEDDGEAEELNEDEKEERHNKIAEKTEMYFEKLEKKKEKVQKLIEASTKDLEKTDKNYGNPAVSFLSYFKYFENPASKKNHDWLVASKLDSYSTTFDLKNDEVLTENRFFRYEISLLLRNILNKNFSKDSITVKEMHELVYELYKKTNTMVNLEKNPAKKKLSKKCGKGYFRNQDFKCQKQKTRKAKKIGYTKATLKQIVKKNRAKTEKMSNKKTLPMEQKDKHISPSQKSETILEPSSVKSTSHKSNSTKVSEKSNPSKKNLFQRLFGSQ